MSIRPKVTVIDILKCYQLFMFEISNSIMLSRSDEDDWLFTKIHAFLSSWKPNLTPFSFSVANMTEFWLMVVGRIDVHHLSISTM